MSKSTSKSKVSQASTSQAQSHPPTSQASTSQAQSHPPTSQAQAQPAQDIRGKLPAIQIIDTSTKHVTVRVVDIERLAVMRKWQKRYIVSHELAILRECVKYEMDVDAWLADVNTLLTKIEALRGGVAVSAEAEGEK
jgi:hypothetical protein